MSKEDAENTSSFGIQSFLFDIQLPPRRNDSPDLAHPPHIFAISSALPQTLFPEQGIGPLRIFAFQGRIGIDAVIR